MLISFIYTSVVVSFGSVKAAFSIFFFFFFCLTILSESQCSLEYYFVIKFFVIEQNPQYGENNVIKWDKASLFHKLICFKMRSELSL